MQKKYLFFCLATVFSLGVSAQTLDESVFMSPAHEYGPMTWWHWINGNVTREGIRKDLTEMNKVGIRGVQMFNTHMYVPQGPVEFATDEWFDLVHYAIEVCDSLDMKFTCMTGAGWSGSGGPWIDKEKAMKRLVWSETPVRGGGKISIQLAQPKAKDAWYRDEVVIAVPAGYMADQIADIESKTMVSTKNNLNYPAEISGKEPAIDLGSVLDLTSSFRDCTLKCTLPQGDWTVIRFGFTLTGKKSHPAAYGGEGYEVDKFDPVAVAFQWDNLMGKLCDKNRKYLGTTFEGILFDSYEASWQNWTFNMRDMFKEFCGYDLTSYMPLFTGRYVESAQKGEKVLYDFRQLCDHLLVNSFYGTMQKKANEVGMVVYAEGQGGPVPASAMDKIDIPMNEFWNPDSKGRLTKIKLTSSQADLRGRRIVAAEAFTSKPEDGKWKNTPATMKKPGDLAFAGGINRYCFHTYAHQPLDYIAPGFSLGRYGIMLSRLNTWWDYSPAWMQYITRSQYMLQQGRTVADICFLFHEDIRYNFPSGMVRTPAGMDYIIAYPDQFDGTVAENGFAVLPSGHKVQTVVYVDDSSFDASTVQTLKALEKAGVMVTKYHKKLYSELKSLTPDVEFGQETDNAIYYRHRQDAGFDYYYVTNQTGESVAMEPSFRVAGKQPELWDPVTGKVTLAPVLASTDRTVKTRLDLGPYESLFVVFRNGFAPASEIRTAQKVNSSALAGKWEVEFLAKNQMPDKLQMPVLTSWSENKDERVRYYSGAAVYRTGLDISSRQLSSGKRLLLSLGKVADVARVVVNGKNCGTAWTWPFSVDISDAVIAGRNNVEIYVANTWINRIIGDEQLPDDVKYDIKGGSKFTVGRIQEYPSWMYSGSQPKNRKRIAFYIWKHYNADSPLVPSGLLGPVELEEYVIK